MGKKSIAATPHSAIAEVIACRVAADLKKIYRPSTNDEVSAWKRNIVDAMKEHEEMQQLERRRVVSVPKVINPTDEAIRKIAMEVGKQVVDHIERMHPEMVKAAPSWKSSRLSIRNCTHNAIIAAVNAADRGQDEKFVKDNEEHRRKLKRIRRAKTLDEIIRASR